MAAPILVLSVPAAALAPHHEGATETLLLGGSILLSVGGLCWRARIHRHPGVLQLFVPGVLLVGAERLAAPGGAETRFVVGGACLLAASRVLNHHLCRHCRRCSETEPARDV